MFLFCPESFNFVATKLLILQLTYVQDLDNMGKMGNVHEVFTRVGSALKTSGQFSAFSFQYFIDHKRQIQI